MATLLIIAIVLAIFAIEVAVGILIGRCVAWMLWELRGARTCMFTLRIGVAASAGRCC